MNCKPKIGKPHPKLKMRFGSLKLYLHIKVGKNNNQKIHPNVEKLDQKPNIR